MEMRSGLRIGEWWADPTTNELRRAGGTVRIEPKAMEVLMALAARPGEVVTREQLLAAVWPGVVVGDEALTQSVIKLRRALGDSPKAPTHVETISKRGYRLIAPVGGEPAPLPRHRRRWAWAAASAVLAAAAAAAYYFAVPEAPVAPMALAEPLTVTVMPFEAMGSGQEHDYLARGIGSDLMTDLSRLRGLQLISPSAGKAAGAAYVVTGSVQRDGSSLRINVRLTNSRTGQQIWTERYDRPFGDLFALQNEITRSVAEHLPGRISEAERQRLARRYTHDPQAYDYFLRGQALFLVRRTQDNQAARALFGKALELDPKFARAYAALAMTYAMEYRYQSSAEASAPLARARELAETARQIDPGIPEVHWALGFVQAQSRRHEEALGSLQQAVELNPSYADAYAFMGGIHTYIGQPAKSIPLLRAALRLNPDGGHLYYLLIGRAYLFENDVEQALFNLRQAHARNPDDLECRLFLTAALVARGEQAEAEWEAEQIRTLELGFSLRGWLETYPLTSAAHQKKLLALLARVGL
jgi:DNA-binding winged helix-turn-helix (wHTH) protein/TolB-like protein/cytochrome c-type biogenesis protein CcmH/NrfG